MNRDAGCLRVHGMNLLLILAELGYDVLIARTGRREPSSLTADE